MLLKVGSDDPGLHYSRAPGDVQRSSKIRRG